MQLHCCIPKINPVATNKGNDVKTKTMSVTAGDIRVGDRIIMRPTWPEGRLVVDVSNGPLEEKGRWNLRITFDGDDQPRTFYRSDEPVLVRRPI
ncbi:conserved hypothetical protein [Burkholderia vietnamiensis]|nr:conserved hypothetical protein [Burkholderia vietnamiensis]